MKKLNQKGSFHYLLLIAVVVVAVALVAIRVGKSNATQTPTTKTASTTTKLPARVANIAYTSGTCADTRTISNQMGDMYPSPVANSPVVVFVHGGGWIGNSRLQFVNEVRYLQAQNISVFNIDYCLDSTTISAFPMEVDDVKLAAQWAIANASQYNGNPSDVILLGGSSGGQLVGMAAEQLNAAASGTIKGVVTLSGPTNFVSLVQDDYNGQITDTSFAANIPRALGCIIKPITTTKPENTCSTTTETQWSPALQVNSSNCPAGWQIFNSQNELMPMDQPNAMISALQANNCQVTSQILPGTAHAFGYWSSVESSIASFIHSL